jgi:hypothetical protein
MFAILWALNNHLGRQLGSTKRAIGLKGCDDANDGRRKICWSQG